jgi:putative ABC transport system permease protein
MRFTELLRASWRSLRAHGFRTSLTVVGMALGMSALLDVLAVCEGARQQAIRKYTARGRNYCVFSVKARKGRVARPLRSADVTFLAQHCTLLEGVAATAQGEDVRISSRGGRSWVALEGVSPTFFQLRRLGLARGRYFFGREVSGRMPAAVLGAAVADQVVVGPHLLDSPLSLLCDSGTRLNIHVVGVAARTGEEKYDSVVYLPVSYVQQTMLGAPVVHELIATTSSLELTPVLQRQVERALEGRNVYVQSENQLYLIENETREVRRLARLIFCAALGLGLINALVVAKVLVTSTQERRREVGLRKAIGARSSDILWQYLLEPTIAAGGGLVLGIAAGRLTLVALSLLTPYPPSLPWHQVGWIGVSTLLLACAASALPAWHASQLDPAQTLRAE